MLAVTILAAGKGTRMKSKLPKVLQPLGGVTLIERVLKSCMGLNPDRILLIVGHQADLVQEKLSHISDIEFIEQKPQNGTGHAVQQLLPVLNNFEGELLVLNGDVPLLRQETLERLLSKQRTTQAGVTFLTATLNEPSGYGRVIANEKNQLRVIEDRDCSKEQKRIKLTNAGIYCFNWDQLSKILPRLSNKNNQKELYLTDTVSMFENSMHLEVEDAGEVSGINNRCQMADCEVLIQERLRKHWMMKGVTFIDEKSCTLSELCNLGRDIIIEPQTHLRGRCKIGDDCKIGPGTLIEDAELGNNVSVRFSIITNAIVGNDVEIGPYAHLRPQTLLGDKCKIGNFVEIKKSVVGEGTKVNHLSYLGDAELGRKVNIGAGTITANYDGTYKHRTIIGDNSKTGANSVLVAPIVLGTEVTVGAGSILTKPVPNNALAIARAKQSVKLNWSNEKVKTDHL